MKSAFAAVVTALLLLIGRPAVAAAASAPSIVVPFLAKEPTMTGRVDASWKAATRIVLAYDYTNRRAAAKPAIAYVAQDPTGIDVAFVVRERPPIQAATLSNGPGVFGDDNVQLALNPQGTQGFAYTFIANARGARFQSSSENSAYTPTWTAAGRENASGYTVTMHVPFSVIRTGGSHRWIAQFLRFAVRTNSTDVWSYNPAAMGTTDPVYDGTLVGMMPAGTHAHAASTRPKARFQPYVLGVARSAAAGGSTSQMGLDMAVPITPTASFVGSFHPDYSNVAIDQQTISPTAFPRQYQEVRPFFTQIIAFDSHFGCMSCPISLYTPLIPTFRQGYGIEGTQGLFKFSGFDAVGTQRTDAAGAVDYYDSTPTHAIGVNAQRVSVNTPLFTDSTTEINGGYANPRGHVFVYANYGRENGTFVTDPAQARYGELGGAYASADTTFIVARQFVGSQYNPVDGYVAQPDIAGYLSFGQKTVHFPVHSRIQDIQISANAARFWNHLGRPAQSNAGYQVNLDLKNLLSLHVFQQSTYVLTSQGEYLPFSNDNAGAMIGYNLNSNYPIGLIYGAGAYYHGRATTWQFFDTVPLRRQISLSLSLNENAYASQRADEPSFRQWLNSAAVNWQFSRDASLSLGARRINGINFPNAYVLPNFTPIFADNLSAAFHYLHGHNEFYVVYGDPNALTTTPALFLKWIFYAGAAKGT